METKRNRRRYYLHRKIRKNGFNLDAKKRTIFVPYTETNLDNDIKDLRNNYGYAVQTEIV